MRIPTRSGKEIPIKQKQNRSGESSGRNWRHHPLLYHPSPVQTLEQSFRMRLRQTNHPSLNLRPNESLCPRTLQIRTMPVPSHSRIFNLPPRFDRNTTVTPECGSSFSSVCTKSARALCRHLHGACRDQDWQKLPHDNHATPRSACHQGRCTLHRSIAGDAQH